MGGVGGGGGTRVVRRVARVVGNAERTGKADGAVRRRLAAGTRLSGALLMVQLLQLLLLPVELVRQLRDCCEAV